jgi:hypothetical protein
MPEEDPRWRRFQARVEAGADGRAYVALPFHPAEPWGRRRQYHVTGRLNGEPVRGPLEEVRGSWRLALGPAIRRDQRIEVGDTLEVELAPEGPQLDELPEELAAALEREPEARAFFESLPTFYRKGYLRWLDGSRRRPEVHAARIREWIALLREGRKSR